MSFRSRCPRLLWVRLSALDIEQAYLFCFLMTSTNCSRALECTAFRRVINNVSTRLIRLGRVWMRMSSRRDDRSTTDFGSIAIPTPAPTQPLVGTLVQRQQHEGLFLSFVLPSLCFPLMLRATARYMEHRDELNPVQAWQNKMNPQRRFPLSSNRLTPAYQIRLLTVVAV